MGGGSREGGVVIRNRLSRVTMRTECDTKVSAREVYDVVK